MIDKKLGGSMQILELSIKNFRGIKSFNQYFGDKKLICFVGQGDSGKSTILEAIALALSPNWNIPFNDSDFFVNKIDNPIEIEVSVKLPKDFILENKFGLYMRFWDKEKDSICDELNEKFDKVLTIKLEVGQDLQPKWYVFNNCQEENFREIGQTDRAKFNCFMVTDYIDRHFTWSTGTPLYSLMEDPKNSKFCCVEPMRKALEDINNTNFADFNTCFTENITKDTKLIDVDGVKTLMDSRDIYSNSNKLSLHDKDKIPFRLKGKGTKRLLSTMMQLSNNEAGAITLIDEFEQGLEPYRIKTFVAYVKTKLQNQNQVFITTHSSNVATELDAENIYIVRNSNNDVEVINVSKDLQNIVRFFPDVLFSKKIIICEGKTELGIAKAIDYNMINNDKHPMSYYGCIPVCGEGDNFYDYCKKLNDLKFNLLVFCDSDLNDEDKKNELKKIGIQICECEKDNCVEKQIFSDLPDDSIIELINHVTNLDLYEGDEKRLIDRVKSKSNNFPNDWKNNISDDVRTAFAATSIAKPKSGDNKTHTSCKSYWFKDETGGRKIGEIILKNFDKIKDDKCIKKQIITIIGWIEKE